MKEISQESNDCLAVPIDKNQHEEFKLRGTRSQESTPTKAMRCLCYLMSLMFTKDRESAFQTSLLLAVEYFTGKLAINLKTCAAWACVAFWQERCCLAEARGTSAQLDDIKCLANQVGEPWDFTLTWANLKWAPKIGTMTFGIAGTREERARCKKHLFRMGSVNTSRRSSGQAQGFSRKCGTFWWAPSILENFKDVKFVALNEMFTVDCRQQSLQEKSWAEL